MRSAYLGVATTGQTGTELTHPVTIDGIPVTMGNPVPSEINSYNYFSNVTALVKSKLDASGPGTVSFTVAEPEPDLTDGEELVVIFDDPAVTADQTISILFGALDPAGDTYQVDLAAPIVKRDHATHLEMSLGISYSYQFDGTQQYSTVDVNGQRLSTSAGGEDDGRNHNGALITAGGDGDLAANPTDSNAPPSNARSDDELYDLIPFVNDGDKRIVVGTTNPSGDDNVFMVTFTMNPPVTQISTDSGPAYVAIGDSTTTGFSVPTCHAKRVVSEFGCVGSPPATPYPDLISASDPRFKDEQRVGIWGYTIKDAVAAANAGHNAEGPWEPQLISAAKATHLVTVSAGANDMNFSDVKFWMTQCLARQFTTLARSTCLDAAGKKAESIRPYVQAMMNRLDQAKKNGAEVIITLYYNPYNNVKQSGPLGVADRDCGLLWAISQIVVSKLNTVLAQEARIHGFNIADLGPEFEGHAAGAKDSYVWGSDCDISGAVTATKLRFAWPPVDKSASVEEIQKRFDPHPNGKGTQAQAEQILQAVN